MAVIIDMPKMSDTMTVGTLVNWLKNEGDAVQTGDMIAEVETDKATMELECFEDGILLKQYAKAGDQIAIGAPIAAIGEKGESAPDAPSGSSAKTDKKEETPVPKAATPTPASPVVEVTTPATSGNGRLKASPLARKMADDLGLTLGDISGTGPQGRIVKADILAAQSSGGVATMTAPAATATIAAPVATLADTVTPVSNMRRTIAQHLTTSKTTIPHFYLNIEVDAAPLMELRAALNANLADLAPEQGGIKFTVNDFILKASAEALKRVPVVNSSWQGDTIQQFGAIQLSFGVAVPDGLVTPVIRDAGTKSLRQISAEAKELVGKARTKKLKPEEMTGSTFTVTNLGMFGISEFYGIVNPPNAGILSVGATIDKPVVKDGAIVPGKLMNIGFSGDHRVVDGAAGAQYLQALRSILETPALTLV